MGIKSSASASSLDRIAAGNQGSSSADLGATRKLSKSHKQSSKDKLNDLLKIGSKEKLHEEKELKRQLKHQQKHMQQQEAQQSSHVFLQPAPLVEPQSDRLHSKLVDSNGVSCFANI